MSCKEASSLMLIVVLLAACSSGASTGGALARPAEGGASPTAAAGETGTTAVAPAGPISPPVNVSFGNNPNGSLAAVYMALERGYFEAEGLNVTLETFANAESMIPVMAKNQLDVSSSGVNSATFSAIGRGIPIKYVAGISRNMPELSSSALVVRKELIDSGRVRDYADLRGLRVSLISATSALGAEYYRVLEMGGLTDQDVDLKILGFPEAALALTNGAIDAGIMTEPFVARLVQSGAGVRWKGADEIYPDHQITALLYSPGFRENQPEAAVRFLVAYIRAAREYNAIMKSNDRTPVYQILAEYTPIKDMAMYSVMYPSGIDPDAALNVASLEADQNLWASQGHVQPKADLAQAVDLQYRETALKRLDGNR
jgi:NitT/TauT family transport system substrate-binding protein